MKRGFFNIWRRDFDTRSYGKLKLIGFHQYLKNKVNLKAKEWRGTMIYPGQFATSVGNMASDTGESIKSIRLMLNALKADGLIKTENRANRYTLVTICNPHLYGLQPCMAGLTKGQAKGQAEGQTKGQAQGQQPKEYNNNNIPPIVPPSRGDTGKPAKKRKRFVKPTVKEIEEYCIERKNDINAQYFWNHYESKGWKIGKSQMKCWKSAIRTWEANNKKNNPKPKTTKLRNSF